MLEPDVVSELLDAFTDSAVARKRGKEVHTLRGVRGVPTGEIARVAAAVWEEQEPTIADEAALTRLFGTAWEDGLIAIGLLAAILPDAPNEALDIARDWADRVDDHQTADALGSLLLGPGVLASGVDPVKALNPLLHHRRAAVRRAAVLAGLAMVPEELTGPSVAPLRARLGSEGVMFVDAPRTKQVRALVDAGLRDPDASVRKGLRRVVSAWAVHDPDHAEAWMEAVKGGVPKIIKEAVVKGARKGRRLAARAERAAAEAAADGGVDTDA